MKTVVTSDDVHRAGKLAAASGVVASDGTIRVGSILADWLEESRSARKWLDAARRSSGRRPARATA